MSDSVGTVIAAYIQMYGDCGDGRAKNVREKIMNRSKTVIRTFEGKNGTEIGRLKTQKLERERTCGNW